MLTWKDSVFYGLKLGRLQLIKHRKLEVLTRILVQKLNQLKTKYCSKINFLNNYFKLHNSVLIDCNFKTQEPITAMDWA